MPKAEGGKTILPKLAIALSILLTASMHAAAADTARARMEAFSKNLHAVTANFDQSVTDANGHRGDGSRGSLALEAPRQFRWETTAPYQQTLVADGSRVWIYEPDLQQVSVRDQNTEEAHSPLTVLTDLTQLDRDFAASEAGERDGLLWLKLTSRAKEPQFEYAQIGFGADAPQRMEFKDQLGNITRIRFDDWKRNPTLPPATFKFVPPKGVDVVGDTVPPAAPAAPPAADVYPVKD